MDQCNQLHQIWKIWTHAMGAAALPWCRNPIQEANQGAANPGEVWGGRGVLLALSWPHSLRSKVITRRTKTVCMATKVVPCTWRSHSSCHCTWSSAAEVQWRKNGDSGCLCLSLACTCSTNVWRAVLCCVVARSLLGWKSSRVPSALCTTPSAGFQHTTC